MTSNHSRRWRSSRAHPQSRHNGDRIRRARSWLERSRQADAAGGPASGGDDYAPDYERFIFLWIAFSAAYDVDSRGYEQQKIEAFLNKIIALDAGQSIKGVLETHADTIQSILNNTYTSPTFWNMIRKLNNYVRFTQDRKRPSRQVYEGAIELFERLYQIRNQIFHGNMTHATGWGKIQVREGCLVLSALLPAMLAIMENDISGNPKSGAWGRVRYPNINKHPEP